MAINELEEIEKRIAVLEFKINELELDREGREYDAEALADEIERLQLLITALQTYRDTL